MSQGSLAKALAYYLRSLSLSEKTQDPFDIAQALVNLGGVIYRNDWIMKKHWNFLIK